MGSGAMPAWKRKENDTARPIARQNLLSGFLDNVEKIPNKTALICESDRNSQYTYRETWARACAFAAALRRKGVEAGQRVAVSLPRGKDAVCAVLGVLMMGGVYVPVSLGQPFDRRKRIYDRAGIHHCITVHHGAAAPEDCCNLFAEDVEPASFLPTPASPEASAYIIFTSGSTGDPKGVEIAHHAAWNTIADVSDRFALGMEDVALNISSLDFDLSVFDIFGILACGGTLVLLSDETHKDPIAWMEQVRRYGVTIWNTVPTLFEMFLLSLRKDEPLETLRMALLSGDYVMPRLVSLLREHSKCCRFIALGGATEAAIWSNCFEVGTLREEWYSIPYGKPLANQQFRVVLDGRDVADGEVGELWIGGDGLAKGYVGDVAQTASTFVFDTEGKRWYRTGDLGYYGPEGDLIFHGRLDNQVKLGGFRVELGEVENQLADLPHATRVLALADRDSGRDDLYALIETELPPTCSVAEISVPEETPADDTELDDAVFSVMREILAELGEKGSPETAPVLTLWRTRLAERDVVAPAGHAKSDFMWQLTEKKQLLLDVLQGQKPSLAVLEDEFLSPARLMSKDDWAPIHETFLRWFSEVLPSSAILPVTVAVLCGREGDAVVELLKQLKAQREVRIIYFESSDALLASARERLTNEGISAEYIRTDHNYLDAAYAGTADAVISLNGPHLFRDISQGLRWIRLLVRPGGHFFMAEPARLPSVGYLSAAVLENGFSYYRDERRGTGKPMLPPRQWATLMARNGWILNTVTHRDRDPLYLYSAIRPEDERLADREQVQQYARERLVYYMVPDQIGYCSYFPLTENGKVDRKMILNWFRVGTTRMGVPPADGIETRLAALWRRLLGREDIWRDDNFFEIGGDSLLSARLLTAIRNCFNVICTMRDIFDAPKLKQMATFIEARTQDGAFEEGEI